MEEIRSDALNDGVVERFFSPGEVKKLKSLEGEERILDFSGAGREKSLF